MSRFTLFGGLAQAAACAFLLATAAPAAAAADPSCAPALPLRWVYGDDTSAAVIAEAEREAARIWRASGIGLDWTRFADRRAPRPEEILVLVRGHLPVHREGESRRRHTLGRLIRASEQAPGRVIEVALTTVAAMVLSQDVYGRAIRDLPPVWRDRAIGRALGRVLAHEIGHWLFGRDHAAAGLMRASLRRPDLIAEDPPALPAGWPTAALAQLRTHRPCPALRAVPQPVTE